MTIRKLAWVAIAAMAVASSGLAAACSDSTGTGDPTNPGGDDDASSVDGSQSDGSGGGDDGGTGGDASPTDAAPDTGTCGAAPFLVGPGDGGTGVYCPFDSTDGGKFFPCQPGQHCCEGTQTGNISTCSATCGAADAGTSDGGAITLIDWECADAVDCTSGTGHAGPVCCGTGQFKKDDVCTAVVGSDYWRGSGFKGTKCKTACDPDPAKFEFVVCQNDAQCTAAGLTGKTCTPFSSRGNKGIGWCQ